MLHRDNGVPAVWPEYLELCEDVNLRILGIVAEAGASLALPAQNLVVDLDRQARPPLAGPDTPAQ